MSSIAADGRQLLYLWQSILANKEHAMRDDLTKHGAFSWFELQTSDAEAAKDFYAKIFGWEYEKFPMEDQNYLVIKQGGEGVGGIMTKPAEAAQAPNYWATYVTVDDVDAVAASVTANGGNIIVPPMDIPEIGRFTVFMDPQGAVLSAITYVDDPK
jgi:uncharacterized protein